VANQSQVWGKGGTYCLHLQGINDPIWETKLSYYTDKYSCLCRCIGVGDKWVMENMSGQPAPRMGKGILGLTGPTGNVGPENGSSQNKRYITCAIILKLVDQTVGLTA
jgi:hypothetical protein